MFVENLNIKNMVDETKIDGIPVYEIYKNLSLKDMTGEEWKDIEGYEGMYMVSNYGRIKSLGNGNSNNSKERILQPGENNRGYLQVDLCKESNKKMLTVHRLVANAFIPNPYNKPQVNHISEPLYDKANKDLAKKDNRVSNIEWCDNQYNKEYSSGKKILCVEKNTIYQSSHDAERQTGINQSNLIQCCQGKRKSAGKLHWEYVN